MKSKRILVIEDDPFMRETLQDVVEDKGYYITTVANGKRGISLHEKEHYDLIITDVLMPDIDGLEVIMKIRQNFPQTKLLAVSGGGHISSKEYLMMARELGSNGVVQKPFNNDELVEKIASLLND